MIRNSIVVLLILCLFGCKENDLIDYNTADSYVYFAYPNSNKKSVEKFTDSIYYSFAADEDLTLTEKTIKIPIKIAGLPTSQNREYKYVISDSSDYDASLVSISEPKIAGNAYEDTLRIKIKRSSILSEKEMMIKLVMESNENFIKGHRFNQSIKLVFSDILVEPTWWNTWRRYFGTYHKEILQKWMQIYYLGADMSPHLTEGTPGPIYYWNNMPSSATPSWYPITFMYLGILKDYFANNVVYPNGDSSQDRILLP